MKSIDGPYVIQELKGHRTRCWLEFLPFHGETLGFDARASTPLLVGRAIVSVAQTDSIGQSEIAIDGV